MAKKGILPHLHSSAEKQTFFKRAASSADGIPLAQITLLSLLFAY